MGRAGVHLHKSSDEGEEPEGLTQREKRQQVGSELSRKKQRVRGRGSRASEAPPACRAREPGSETACCPPGQAS